jgi:hypothetical protein
VLGGGGVGNGGGKDEFMEVVKGGMVDLVGFGFQGVPEVAGVGGGWRSRE